MVWSHKDILVEYYSMRIGVTYHNAITTIDHVLGTSDIFALMRTVACGSVSVSFFFFFFFE